LLRKILIGYLNAKVERQRGGKREREYIFKLIIGNESLHQDSNANRKVRSTT